MEKDRQAEFDSFVEVLPPIEFGCVYGSSLHQNNHDKSTMTDYILGVSDPEHWHSENLKVNKNHYASWMAHLGGARLITQVADEIGVGVHFNPYVHWNGKMVKYGVVRMHDLVQDVLNWERLYLSGRLQKPVQILVDNLEMENVNSVNLRAALSAALLFLPPDFMEEDLYAKICRLSYDGDVRMLFAEDKRKEKKIVSGQFDLFRSMYKPFIEEYETKGVLRLSSTDNQQVNISQDFDFSAAGTLVSILPPAIKSALSLNLGDRESLSETGRVRYEVAFSSREKAAKSLQKVLRRKVLVSSTRQAISGFLGVGIVNGTRYLANKIGKSWRSLRSD